MRIAPRRKVIVHGVMLGLLLACGAFVACSGGGTPATYQEGGDSGVPVVVPDGATGGKDVTAKDVVTVDVVAKDVTVKDVGAIDVEVKDVTVKDVVVFDGNAPVYLKDVVVVEDVQEVERRREGRRVRRRRGLGHHLSAARGAVHRRRPVLRHGGALRVRRRAESDLVLYGLGGDVRERRRLLRGAQLRHGWHLHGFELRGGRVSVHDRGRLLRSGRAVRVGRRPHAAVVLLRRRAGVHCGQRLLRAGRLHERDVPGERADVRIPPGPLHDRRGLLQRRRRVHDGRRAHADLVLLGRRLHLQHRQRLLRGIQLRHGGDVPGVELPPSRGALHDGRRLLRSGRGVHSSRRARRASLLRGGRRGVHAGLRLLRTVQLQ